MSKHIIFDKEIEFSEAQDRFISLVQAIPQLKKDAKECFQEIFDEWDDIDDLLDGYEDTVNDILYELLKDKLYGYLIEADIYDISEEAMIRKCWETSSSDEAYNIIAKAYNKILEEYEDEVEYRELRKASRGRVVGGGFGVKGAVKGMAVAGAMNAVTGLGHSIVNAFGNLKSSWDAEEAKDELFESEDTYNLLEIGVVNSVVETIESFVNYINEYKESEGEEVWIDGSSFDVDRAETLLTNAVKFKEKRAELLLKAFLLCPYHPDICEAIFVAYTSERHNIINVCKTLHMDVAAIIENFIASMYPSEKELSEEELVDIRKNILSFMSEFNVSQSETLDSLEEELIYLIAEEYDELEFDKKEDVISKIVNCEVSEKIKKTCIYDNEIWELFERYNITIPEDEKLLLLFGKYEEIRLIKDITPERIIELLDPVINAIDFKNDDGIITYETREKIFECLTQILQEQLKSKLEILNLQDDLTSNVAEKAATIIRDASVDFLTTSLRYRRPHEELDTSNLSYYQLSNMETAFIIYDERPLMYPGGYGFCLTDKRLVGKSEYGGSFNIPTSEIISFEKKGFLSNNFIVHTSNGSKEINVENLSSIGDFVDCLNQILTILPNNKRAIQIREAELNKKIIETSIANINKHPWLIEYLGMGEKVEQLRRMATPIAHNSRPVNSSANSSSSQQSTNNYKSNSTNDRGNLSKSSTKSERQSNNPFNNISTMTSEELQAKLASIKTKNYCNKFYEVNSPQFMSKISKAISAYATLNGSERILLMYDATVFGSAKEGFVLTDKHIYIKKSFSSKESISIKDITNITSEKSSSMTYLYFVTNNQKYEFYFSSDATEVEQCKNYIWELVSLLKLASSSTQSVSSSNNWICTCGNTNTGKFCSKCGTPKSN